MVIYYRKEGRALGEVTKYLVYNMRKRQEGGDRAEEYFNCTQHVAGVTDSRFQAIMPDPLHWLGITKIHKLISMSNMKYDAITASGIEVVERVPIPPELVPKDAAVEITAKVFEGYEGVGARSEATCPVQGRYATGKPTLRTRRRGKPLQARGCAKKQRCNVKKKKSTSTQEQNSASLSLSLSLLSLSVSLSDEEDPDDGEQRSRHGNDPHKRIESHQCPHMIMNAEKVQESAEEKKNSKETTNKKTRERQEARREGWRPNSQHDSRARPTPTQQTGSAG